MSSLNPNSVLAVAKKDFQDAIRSYMFIGLSMFFFTLLVLAAGLISWGEIGQTLVNRGNTTEGLISVVQLITRLVIPLVAIILGWKAIAGERESGSLKVLLSLPHSRTDVLVGKLIGRALVLIISLVIGFLLAGIIVWFLLSSFSVTDYIGLLIVSLLYGVAYTAIVVSASALSRSTMVAAAAAFGIFVTFYILWNAVTSVFTVLAFYEGFEYISMVETEAGPRLPEWVFFFQMIDPGTAYQNVLTLATSAELGESTTQNLEALFGGNVPFYLQDWFALIVLLVWILVPFAIATVRFKQVDL